MSATTFAFALVATVAFVVAALSLTFAVRAVSTCKRVMTAWETSKPATLKAELAALDAALDAHRRTCRSEFGRIWQRMPAPPPRRNPAAAPHDVVAVDDNDLETYTDPELAAMLALQAPPSAKPNGRP